MPNALVGHTGLVGTTLKRQTAFDELYNSSNVEALANRHFELLVCAAAPAEKWKANADPAQDLANLARLQAALGSATADRVVLISTVDVYPSPIDVDEHTAIAADGAQAYGRHRLALERFATERFDTHVVRLPGLFGRGLKKNVIYDMLHGKSLAGVHADSTFQFYDLSNLWRDIGVALDAGIRLLNVASEPTSVRDTLAAGFDVDFDNRPAGASPMRYRMRSVHADRFGGRDGFLYDRAQILGAVRAFADAERERLARGEE
jgi:nucleoside-diphosphate-sugar epimerase